MATIPLFKMESDSTQHVRHLWKNPDSAPIERNGLFATLEIPVNADSRKLSRRNDYAEAALAMHGNSPHRGISGLPVNSNA